MLLSPIVARLKAQCPLLRLVEPGLAPAVPAAHPAAYIFPLRVIARPNELLGVHDQQITESLGVELTIRNAARASTGKGAADELEAVRQQVYAALAGWPIDPSHVPFNYVGGALIEFDAGNAVWRDEYATETYLRIAV